MALIYVMVFMAITIVVMSASVIVGVISSQSTLKFDLGNQALSIAESGAENGILRLLRDQNYSGEILPVGTGFASISVVLGPTNPVIISEGVMGKFSRTIEVRGSFNNNVLTITSWKEL